jgi:hypothetical protein
MSKGSNRDWGYASYNVDDEDDDKLTYTSYEKNGSVNRYSDNGDGGHSHEHWNSKDDYDSGKDSDWGRSESNSSKNPTTGDVQEKGGCYLTTACVQHLQERFDDNCYELTVLRWFRDNFVSKEDIKHYYETVPVIVSAINEEENSDLVYNYIYDNVVDYCVKQIENGNYEEAYNRYKNSILVLEEQFARKNLEERFVKILRLRTNN